MTRATDSIWASALQQFQARTSMAARARDAPGVLKIVVAVRTG